MTKELDIRWEQRFSNYRKALSKLTLAVEIIQAKKNSVDDFDDVDELQMEGLIQRFEYTHELAWNVVGDYAKYQGYQDIKGSRSAIRYGLKYGLLDDEQWMETISARNRTTYTYNKSTAHEILVNVLDTYYPLFLKFEKKMLEL